MQIDAFKTKLNFKIKPRKTKDKLSEYMKAKIIYIFAEKEQERFAAWLNQIAVNKCKNMLGKKKLVSIDDVEEDVLPEGVAS